MSTGRVRLLGTPNDREELERLARRLAEHGIEADPDLRGPRSTRPLKFEPDKEGQAVRYAVCWTIAALGEDGKRIRECAIELKVRNAYLGLLLDDVSPPDEVQGADDVKLVGWLSAKEDSAGIEALRSRLEAAGKIPGPQAGLAVALAQIAGSLRRISRRLKAVGIVGMLTFAVGVFGVYSNWIGSQDSLCRQPGIGRLCRSIGAGHLPSDAEQSEWNRIARGSSCEAIESYLRRYGHDAAFLKAASLRLDLAREVSADREMLLPLRIPFEQTDHPTRADAEANLRRRAATEAESYCASYGQAFEGVARPGQFVAGGPPNCEGRPGRYLCGIGGQAKCVFRVAGAARVCPPRDPA
jgi:hypothetical protein